MSYTVDATNPAEPTDSREAGMMAAEFRSIKAYLKNVLLKQITDNNTATTTAIAALQAIINDDTGVDSLPDDAGILDVLTTIYTALYTADTGALAKLSSLAATVTTMGQTLNSTQQTLSSLSDTVSQLAQSHSSLNNKVTALTNKVDSLVVDFPIGYVLITKNSANPSTYLKYGTWVRTGEGKYLAGVGKSVLNGATAFNFANAGSSYGYGSVTLSWEQMPPHRHITNVLVRTSKANGQFLTSVDGTPTLGDGVKVIIGSHPQTGEPIYGSEANGGVPAYYTNVYEGSALNTWENHKNYGNTQQGVPYTGYAGGTGINDNGTSKANSPVEIMPLAVAYYMWERTA